MAILGLGKISLPDAGGEQIGQKYFSDKFLLWFTLLSVCAVLVQFVLIGLTWKNLPPQIPIFYSKPWGSGILAAPIYFWILPGFSLLVLVLNLLLSMALSFDNKFLKRIFAFSSLFVCVAILFDIFKIITLIV